MKHNIERSSNPKCGPNVETFKIDRDHSVFYFSSNGPFAAAVLLGR